MVDRTGTHFLTQNSLPDFQIRFFSTHSCNIHPSVSDSQLEFSYSSLGLKLVRIKKDNWKKPKKQRKREKEKFKKEKKEKRER